MYRKKGMERIQDSLLQDLEKATSTLKNHPIGHGGSWKLNKPSNDPTTQSAYSTAKVTKRYSPQYYINDEPLYQNEPRGRSQQSNQNSDHDYAAINGRAGAGSAMSTSATPSTPIYEVPNGGPVHHYHLANGDVRREQRERSTDSDQVNDLIRNLEYNLKNPTSHQHQPQNTSSSFYSNVSKPTTNGSMMYDPRSSSQSPTRTPSSARIQPVSEYNRQLVNIQPQKAQMNENPVIQVPLPSGCGPTSNATRELDDLMASLSDFKMNQIKSPNKQSSNYIALGKVQVPTKTYAPLLQSSDLDSMIGNLEIDLNRQGVSTTAKGNCQACGKIIIGQVVTALGTTWHPEHFCCVKCQRELGDSTFFERDGVAYCEQDYHRLFSPRCGYCNQPIYDRCITALDKTWHPEHFCCAHCGKNFGDEGYHEKAGNAYCREDFFKLFAPKCSGCAKPIEDNYVTALGGQWHQDCFVCRDCKSPFGDGKTYFDFEGKPYCEPHYHDKRGNLCASCRQPITGRCITAMFQKYHPEHFICSFCLKQLNKGTFKKHNEKPYCHSCFDKLFA